jgi:hypothetical protein
MNAIVMLLLVKSSIGPPSSSLFSSAWIVVKKGLNPFLLLHGLVIRKDSEHLPGSQILFL